MAISDRMRSLAGTVGRRLRAFSETAPKIEGIGIMPQVAYAPPTPAVERIANSREALLGRISYNAGPSHTRYSTYIATGLSPATVYSVLQDANLGILYRWADMVEQVLERDGHLRAVDSTRRVEVSGKPFRVQPLNDTPTAITVSKFVRAAVDNIDSFDRSVYAALHSNAIGFSLNEIVWASGKARFSHEGGTAAIEGLFPKKIDWVHPKHLRFDRDTDEPQLDVGGGAIMALPRHKFLFHGAAGEGLFERRGHMRACIWLHLLKQQAFRDWGVFSALFGIPNIIAKYPRGVVEPAEARALYEQFLQDYGQGQPIIVPDDLDVNLTPGPTGTGNSAQQTLIGYCDTSMSKAVQGETLTTELSQTGSYNASETHADTKHSIIKNDARGLASDVRSDVFRAIIELNIDELCKLTGSSPDDVLASVPQCSWRIERETSPAQRSQILISLANAGMKIGVDQIREEFGIDAPSDDADVLSGEVVSIPSGGMASGSVEASQGVDNPKPDEPSPVKQSKTIRKRKTKTEVVE